MSVETAISVVAQSQAFWVFVGIIAGALIQHFLNVLTARRQSRNALKVLQIETVYNLKEVRVVLERIRWLKERISAGQIEPENIFIPMHLFDYSTIAPLSNAGYFHMLLGAENIGRYLKFYNFFRNDNANFLSDKLKQEHNSGKSLEFLDRVEDTAKALAGDMAQIAGAKPRFLRNGLALAARSPEFETQ